MTNLLTAEDQPSNEVEEEVARDTRIEAILDRWGLTYELQQEFPLRRLKIADETQARTAEHRQPTASVDEYAVHMRNGAQFPPILVATNGMLIDGNTRVAAGERVGLDTL